MKLEEFKGNLEQILSDLGVTPAFLENPAFERTIAEIKLLIDEILLDQIDEKVIDKNNEYSLEWSSTENKKWKISLTSSNSKTFTFVRTLVKTPFLNIDDNEVKEKDTLEVTVSIDNLGFIKATTRGAKLTNVSNDPRSKNTSWSEVKIYTPEGIQREIEYKEYEDYQLLTNFDTVRFNEMLSLQKEAKDNQFKTKKVTLRDTLDTARHIETHKEDGIESIIFNSILPLDLEVGLRDMILLPFIDEVIIEPLSMNEIEKIIEAEENKKIREGLKKYSIKRDTYSYNSHKDENFINR